MKTERTPANQKENSPLKDEPWTVYPHWKMKRRTATLVGGNATESQDERPRPSHENDRNRRRCAVAARAGAPGRSRTAGGTERTGSSGRRWGVARQSCSRSCPRPRSLHLGQRGHLHTCGRIPPASLVMMKQPKWASADHIQTKRKRINNDGIKSGAIQQQK